MNLTPAVRQYLTERTSSKRVEVQNHPDPPLIVYDRPLPVEARGGTRKFDHYYPFEDMKPGGSFWVPSNSYCTAGAVTKFAKKTGWRFITRGQTEDGRPNGAENAASGKRGTRVWRVS